MAKKTVRTGIVGAGFAAKFHYEAVMKLYSTQAEVIGVYCRTKKTRDQYARQRGIRAFDTLDALLDSVDVVHICTPPVSHEHIAVAALKRNKFAIVEKPLTGFFGDGSENFDGRSFPVPDSLRRKLGLCTGDTKRM